MSTSISASWLLKGHFDFSSQDPHNTTTLLIKKDLSDALGLPRDGLNIARYPVGPQFSHIFWWREEKLDFAEAQFVAAISESHPVLSLGVSVEKGLENANVPRPEQAMNRNLWDWDRVLRVAEHILSVDVPSISALLNAPIHLRILSRVRSEESAVGWHSDAFSFVEERWFARHRGRVRTSVDEIVGTLRELDGRQDAWGIVHIARDFAPLEVEGMSPSEVASVLLHFDGIRRQLRGQTPAATSARP